MTGALYKTREMFEVARHKASGLTLNGIWYRNAAMEWAVFDDQCKIVHRVPNYALALQLFNTLVAEHEVPA